ncbi:protein disulfide-isomerase [Colletotrichum spaethianum]|uniref:Protein disulfide-isomerase n=1 Tax=Colletotrichum spaethianum TaxID=700344 RepID=A0AA37P984_9PEZI|nr:protein disulfide-isomerase [Colletotrichum spaethianum]GKT47974.1 protein disulfide-isomerase [Colletotrichum spaethianum]
MVFTVLVRLGFWVPLVAGVAYQEQAPLSAETTVLGTEEMRLIACVKHSEDKSKTLEAEWKAAHSSTEFPMSWVDDLTEEPCAGLPADAYPSIRLLRSGQPSVGYLGPQTSDEILRFINRAKRSSQVPVTVSAEAVDSFKGVDNFVCIGRFPSAAADRQAFEAVAKKYWTEFTFGVVDSPGAAEAEVVCHKRDDESVHTRSSGDGLETWVVEASRPVIAELTRLNHQRFLDVSWPLVQNLTSIEQTDHDVQRGWPMVYIFSPSPQTRASIRAELHAFAKKQYSSLTAVTVDPAYFPDLLAKLGLNPSGNDYPVGAVHQLSKGRVYPYPKGRDFTPRELQDWGLDVWQGRIKPWTPPGQEPAEDVGSGNVRIVGSHNLKVKNIPGLKIKIGGRERDEL